MTKKEFYILGIGLKAAYPRFTFLQTNEELEFWYKLLQDINYKIAENAIFEYISTNIFPPSIAEIRKLCIERFKTPVLSFDEAWSVVKKAMIKYGADYPYEAFATMDELTLSVVKNLDWTSLCKSENPESSRANFRDAYKEKARILENQNQIPEFVRQNKKLLQETYIQVEDKETVEINQIETDTKCEVMTDPEKFKKRSEQIEELRRTLRSDKEAERSDTGD